MSNYLITAWQASLRDSGYEVTSTVADGERVFAASNGYVYLLDFFSGEEKARNDLPEMGKREHHEVRMSICSGGDTLFVGINGYAWGIEPYSLNTKWKTSLPGCGYGTTSVLGTSSACFAACNGYLYKLDAHGGGVECRNDMAGVDKREVRMEYHDPTNRLYVGTNGYGLSMNGWDISERWRVSLPGSGYSITSVATGKNHVYFANNGYVFTIDHNGNLVSRNDLPGRGEHETRLAVSLGSEERVFAGINGF
ncbi:hypothetical protein DL93DRAFT_2056795, partial [Clavulina sp. PMI_390]